MLSFGGPEGPDDVLPFLRNVTAGRNVPDERLTVVAKQYDIFGGRSPINDLTRVLVQALKDELLGAGQSLPVYWGTRNWNPQLTETVSQMARDGIKHALVFTNSAFASYSGCRQYQEDLDRARASVGQDAPTLDLLRLYFNHPGFIDPVVRNTARALAEHTPSKRTSADTGRPQLLFTAHSLPQGMADACEYEDQLNEAMELVVERLDASTFSGYELVFQSRSGAPHMPWLGPDVLQKITDFGDSERGTQPLTLVPIGFTMDHMEVLYDLDVQAANLAEELQIPLTRAKTAGTDPDFVSMIRELVEEETNGSTRRSTGTSLAQGRHSGATHCLRTATV